MNFILVPLFIRQAFRDWFFFVSEAIPNFTLVGIISYCFFMFLFICLFILFIPFLSNIFKLLIYVFNLITNELVLNICIIFLILKEKSLMFKIYLKNIFNLVKNNILNYFILVIHFIFGILKKLIYKFITFFKYIYIRIKNFLRNASK